ncbi:unnamed protein product, partial [Rotaria magnacalcarata]
SRSHHGHELLGHGHGHDHSHEKYMDPEVATVVDIKEKLAKNVLLQKNLSSLKHIFGSKDILTTYESERKPDNIHEPDDRDHCTFRKTQIY